MQSSNFTCCFNHPLILIQLMSKDSYMVLWLCWPNSGMRSLHKLKENWGSSSWVFVHSLDPGNWVECTHVYSHTNGPRHSLFITYSPAVICSCVTKSACQSTLRNLIPHADCEQREQSSFVSWEARGGDWPVPGSPREMNGVSRGGVLGAEVPDQEMSHTFLLRDALART